MRDCLQSRAQETNEVFQKYFAEVRLMRKQADTKLSVFSVSSKAQRALVKRTPIECFPDEESTGIAGLVNWIIQGSLPKRERHAEDILFRCQVLFDAIDAWVSGSVISSSLMLTPVDHQSLNSKLMVCLETLDNVRLHTCSSWWNSC
jgi:hypothetical protein